MIKILDNVYAVNVPSDAFKFKFSTDNYLCQVLPENGYYIELHEKPLESTFEILGAVTQTEIDFDVEPLLYVEEEYDGDKMYSTYGKCYNKENGQHVRILATTSKKEAFRSALTAAGITEYQKLVIVQKLP